MAFSMPTGCVRFVRYCGKMYSRHLFTTLLLYRDEYRKCMTFFMPTGCVRFARYCGKMYSRHLYTTLLLCRDEYHKSICLSLCLRAVLGLPGIVVKCTAAIYTQRCYCAGMSITRVYGFLYAYWLC